MWPGVKDPLYLLSIQEVTLVKSGGPLGLSIVGGSDHASHPFGINEPGVFISKVTLTAFLIFDRILSSVL